MDTVTPRLSAVLWVVAVLAIALGAAGIVTAMEAQPPGGSRPELTTRGDARASAALDEVEAALRPVAADVDALGTEARGALAALNGTDLATVEAAVERGDALVDSIRSGSAAVQAALAAVPIVHTPAADYELSDAVRARYARLFSAAQDVERLDGAWAGLTLGSLAASRLSARLADHDDAVLKAAEQGRRARYGDAIKTLDDADAALDAARKQRDQLAKTVDVTTLDEWIARNAEYDTALRDLYGALRAGKGKVTKDVRAAIAAEAAAKDRLPPDNRGMVLIMSDIGRGGMNDAVVTIERARGELADALGTVGASDAPSPAPSPR